MLVLMSTQVLLIAMALSYGTLDFIEGAVISAVIVLNIVLGFVICLALVEIVLTFLDSSRTFAQRGLCSRCLVLQHRRHR